MSDYAVVMGDETLEVFDNLGDAVGIWRPRRKDGARIINILGNGTIWAAIVGDAEVRARGKPGSRRRWVRSVPTGWTRIEPPQRGSAVYGLSKSETASLHPGMTVINTVREGASKRLGRRPRG